MIQVGYGKSAEDIVSWSKHVHASNALPTVNCAQDTWEINSIGRQEDDYVFPQQSAGPTFSVHYRATTPSTPVRGLILRRLSELIGVHEIPEILRNLPSPRTKPLVGRL